MKIELDENIIYFNNGSVKKEIHPFWLRERVDGEEFLDKGTQQRLFDPTTLSNEISINTATINKDMNNSPQYILNGGAYLNLTSTGDPKIWTFILDPTSLTTNQYTFTVTGTCVNGGYTYDPSTGIIDGDETGVDSLTFEIFKLPREEASLEKCANEVTTNSACKNIFFFREKVHFIYRFSL